MFKHNRPLAVAIAAASLLTSAAACADVALTAQIVDTFYKIYGTHPGFRVNHAKGVVAEGSFVATPTASALSRAQAGGAVHYGPGKGRAADCRGGRQKTSQFPCR